MEPNAENSCRRDAIKEKLRQNFDGKIVRKDLTKKIKEGANVPVYVLEFLLGQYCSSDDEAIIEKGVQNVKHILADNFVRPDEAQKILSQLRKKGSHTIIDKTHLIDTGDIRADRFDDFFIKRATAILNEIEKATGKSISGRDSDLVIQDFGGALL